MAAVAIKVAPVMVKIAAVGPEVTAFALSGEVAAILTVAAEIDAIMTNIHPVVPDIPAVAGEGALGLGSNGGEKQCYCE